MTVQRLTRVRVAGFRSLRCSLTTLLAAALLGGGLPAAASAQSRHGERLTYFAGSVGTGATAIGLLHHDNLVTADQLGGWTGGFHFVGGLHVERFTFAIFADYIQDWRFFAIPIGVDVSFAFLDERLTPIVRVAFGVGPLLTIGPDDAPALTVIALQAQVAAGLRWFFEPHTPRARDPSAFLSLELEGGFLHLERAAEAGCAPCRSGGVDLARDGTADGLSLRLLLGIGQLW